jgi:hypothetical protein
MTSLKISGGPGQGLNQRTVANDNTQTELFVRGEGLHPGFPKIRIEPTPHGFVCLRMAIVDLRILDQVAAALMSRMLLRQFLAMQLLEVILKMTVGVAVTVGSLRTASAFP